MVGEIWGTRRVGWLVDRAWSGTNANSANVDGRAAPEAIRVGKIVKAVLLAKTLCISHPDERELGHLERGLEPW